MEEDKKRLEGFKKAMLPVVKKEAERFLLGQGRFYNDMKEFEPEAFEQQVNLLARFHINQSVFNPDVS